MKEFSRPDVLMIDWDHRTPPAVEPIHKALRTIGTTKKLTPQWIRLDRTRKGWHIVIQLPCELPQFATVALQAILGSDPRRETLNLMRAFGPNKSPFALKRWNILFDYKLP